MKTESECEDENFKQILCPVLRVGVKEGMLTPNKKGVVQEYELKDYMSFLGWHKKSLMDRVIKSAYKNGVINISRFRGRGLDHGSSSGVINNKADNNQLGFYPTRFEHFLSFASNDNEFGLFQLASAAIDFHKNPVNFNSTKGFHFQLLEFAILLELFGEKNQSGEKVLQIDDIKSLWEKSKFPAHWQTPKKRFFGNVAALKGLVKMQFIVAKIKITNSFST